MNILSACLHGLVELVMFQFLLVIPPDLGDPGDSTEKIFFVFGRHLSKSKFKGAQKRMNNLRIGCVWYPKKGGNMCLDPLVK